MDEIGFSVLKYRERTPVLAACTRCQLKFLTPSQMMKDWEAAREYLWRKYGNHRCASTFSHYKEKNHAPPCRPSKSARHESSAQERCNERKSEEKQVERLLAVLAKKLGPAPDRALEILAEP